MARAMPPLAAAFGRHVAACIALANAGEVALSDSQPKSTIRKQWHPARVSLLYELAYLRMFNEWEVFLEESFVRYLCGFRSTAHVPARVTGAAFYGTLNLAQRAMLGGGSYVLWHNPVAVAKRASVYLVGCPHEVVVLTHSSRLFDFASIRHRIAHAQQDAKRKFDAATMRLAGRRYKGGRPGALLRDWDPIGSPSTRWIETIGTELIGLSSQIA